MTSTKRLKHFLTTTCALCIGLFAMTPSAFAEEQTTVIIFTPALFTTTTTGVVALMVMDPTMTSTSSTTHDLLFGSRESTTTYMAENCTSLEQAITLGDGEALDDLAQMARIAPEDVPAFKAVIQNERAPIIELLSSQNFGEAQAVAIVDIIARAMSAHDQLAVYVPETT